MKTIISAFIFSLVLVVSFVTTTYAVPLEIKDPCEGAGKGQCGGGCTADGGRPGECRWKAESCMCLAAISQTLKCNCPLPCWGDCYQNDKPGKSCRCFVIENDDYGSCRQQGTCIVIQEEPEKNF